MTNRTVRELAATACRWLGRALALLLFLFWGGFFLEHLSEWFMRADGQYPPTRVWVGQALHAGILVGLLMLWRWERLGAIVLAAATAAFFLNARFVQFHWVMLINLATFVVFAAAWALAPRRGPPAASSSWEAGLSE